MGIIVSVVLLQTRAPVSFGDPRRQDLVIEQRAMVSDTEAQLAALEAEEKAERIRQLEAQLEARRRAAE